VESDGADTRTLRPKELHLMKKCILFLSIICASGLTLVSIYNTVVDAKSWGSDIPTSIQTARDYYQHVDPRRFYAIAGSVNQILILLTVILFWKDSVALRFYFATSFLLYAAIVILTLAYFVPRDLVLFTWPIQDHLEQIRAASAQWSRMNWLRSLLGLAGVLFSFKGLDTYYNARTSDRVKPATG
jgi:Anthrone oxygenase